MIDTIIKGETACDISECDSQQYELNYQGGGSWLCDSHLEDIKEESKDMARGAMSELGLPQDEAERMLEDMSL